jgi:hypothetical protein
MPIRCHGNVFTEPLGRNGRCLATGLYATIYFVLSSPTYYVDHLCVNYLIAGRKQKVCKINARCFLKYAKFPLSRNFGFWVTPITHDTFSFISTMFRVVIVSVIKENWLLGDPLLMNNTSPPVGRRVTAIVTERKLTTEGQISFWIGFRNFNGSYDSGQMKQG